MTEPLRIAYVTSQFARPSDSFIRNEVNGLRRLGLDVQTFSIRRPSVVPGDEADVDQHQRNTEYLLEAGLPAIALQAFSFAVRYPRRIFHILQLAWRTSAPGIRGTLRQAIYLVEAVYLASRLEARSIQLLHNHLGENSATVAMLASELSGIPFSLTIHGPYIFFAPEKWALGEKLARAAFTACISDFCRSQCQLFAPISAWRRLHVVRCSVQPMFVDPPPARHSPTIPHFLCVGRLCTEKCQLLIVDAVDRLRVQGSSARITFVGDGPLRHAIERRISELGLESSIELLGWQPSSRVRQLLAETTALVIASAAEGLPVVAMEALAAGCPVVATNIAAMSELIDERTGWLIPPGNVGELAGAMRTAGECGPATLARMGAAGRERVLQLHHPECQARQLQTMFASILVQSANMD